jgi:hypothetical protein
LTQDIYGLYVTLKPIASWTIEPYLFHLADGRAASASGAGTAGLITPQASDQNRSTLGMRINGKAAGLDATVEGAWQTGAIASAANRTAATGNDDRDARINAQAVAAKAGYTFGAVPMKPRIGFEFNYASGDQCVNGGAAKGCTTGRQHFNTFDNLYPTNHFHYGYMDLMAWKNMVNYQVMFDVKPSDVSKLQFNFIIHRLARTTDNWYRANQTVMVATASGNQAASLGQEFNVHYWHTIKEKFKFEIGYGHFFLGEIGDEKKLNDGTSAITALNGASTAAITNATGVTRDQDWGYVMTSILF